MTVSRVLRLRLFVGALCLFVAIPASAKHVMNVPLKGPRQVELMRAQGIEILAFTKTGMNVLVDDKQRDWLLGRNYGSSTLRMNVEAVTPFGPDYDGYTTVAELEAVIASWEATYPSIMRVDSIGSSIEGRTIWAFKISDNVLVDEDEPEVLYMGNHHARELMSVEIPLLFAELLLTSYGSDTELTNYVDTREIYFVPMVNPDGHYYVENNNGGSPNTWWRKNRRVNEGGSIGVDLNRNYGFEWGYDDLGSSSSPTSPVYRGTGPFSEPEAQAIRDFCESREFVMWFSYHSYGELLLYPPGYYYGFTPDQNVFAALGDSMTASNGYLAGNPATGAIYLTNGDSDDWGYGEQSTKPKTFAFTPEVNSYAEGGFGPVDSLIGPTFDKMLPMNKLLLKFADNPYQVVGPYAPVMYAIQQPWYPVHTVNWSASDPSDPNPVVSYRLETCRDPGFQVDLANAMSPLWDFDGWSVSATAYEGTGSYYSGSGDNLTQRLTADRPWVVDTDSDTLSFYAQWNIETDWDYAYVEVSDDGGVTWTTVQGNVTTSSNPNGNNLGHGITGSSPGWVPAIFPLTSWLGQEIAVRLSYVTDAFVVNPGIWVDQVDPVPFCADVTVTSTPDTAQTIVPDMIATYRYRSRGVDAENHKSAWSGVVDITVNTLSAADSPHPTASALGQNYPNPFNPETRIPYTVGGIPGADGQADRYHVTLRIYNVAGQYVATLVDGPKAPGRYAARWNGRDARDAAQSSGVFFVRLTVGADQVFTRKVLLLK